MTKSFTAGIITLAAGIALGFTSTPSFAQGTTAHAPKHHNSNTFVKIGKALQYPVRKAGENLSVDTHRAEGRKSVEVNHSTKEKAVITPSGHKYLIRHSMAWRRRHHMM